MFQFVSNYSHNEENLRNMVHSNCCWSEVQYCLAHTSFINLVPLRSPDDLVTDDLFFVVAVNFCASSTYHKRLELRKYIL